MTERTVVVLVEGGGMLGRTVISHLACDERFSGRYDLRVVVDGEGKTVRLLDRLGLMWVPAIDPRNPSRTIRSLTTDAGLDYLVTCGWGHRLPAETIAMADRAAINCHSSHLPDYKGTSIYRPQWAHAERYGGVTVHHLTDRFDEGDIVTQARFSIGLFDTPLAIARTYSDLAAPVLREALELLEGGYGGRRQSGGRYYSTIPWKTTLAHGLVNHVLRAIGAEARWEIEPKYGSKPERSGCADV